MRVDTAPGQHRLGPLHVTHEPEPNDLSSDSHPNLTRYN
jgi:hypothetical protein